MSDFLSLTPPARSSTPAGLNTSWTPGLCTAPRVSAPPSTGRQRSTPQVARSLTRPTSSASRSQTRPSVPRQATHPRKRSLGDDDLTLQAGTPLTNLRLPSSWRPLSDDDEAPPHPHTFPPPPHKRHRPVMRDSPSPPPANLRRPGTPAPPAGAATTSTTTTASRTSQARAPTTTTAPPPPAATQALSLPANAPPLDATKLVGRWVVFTHGTGRREYVEALRRAREATPEATGPSTDVVLVDEEEATDTDLSGDTECDDCGWTSSKCCCEWGPCCCLCHKGKDECVCV